MSKLTDNELIEELRSRFRDNRESLEELQELNRELKVVNKKLEESEALKSHFISNITNEIINPFTSILGLAKHILGRPRKVYCGVPLRGRGSALAVGRSSAELRAA